MDFKQAPFSFFLHTSVLVFSLIILSHAASAQSQSQPASPGGYVGDEKCKECHEDVFNALTKSVHGSKEFHEYSDHGCETCHGPGQAHAESGDKTLIHTFNTMKSTEITQVCLTCHESGKVSHWKGSVHEQRNLNCTVCHSIHNFKSTPLLKAASVEETCGNCHQQIQAQIQRTSHHPVREGLISCASCHNPHGTDTPKLVAANSNNELCYKCHTEKRGPFLWDHPPVRENCMNCHTPHGSNHPKLLVSKRPYLCQRCHLDTRHPGTLYDGNNLLTSNREFARSCSNCHLTVHGSNHPSGQFLLR